MLNYPYATLSAPPDIPQDVPRKFQANNENENGPSHVSACIGVRVLRVVLSWTQNLLFACDIKRYGEQCRGTCVGALGGRGTAESHGRSAWKLNGVPFPCRDCHFRFLYLYKSQSKPKIHAEHEAAGPLCVPPLCRFYGSQKVGKTQANRTYNFKCLYVANNKGARA